MRTRQLIHYCGRAWDSHPNMKRTPLDVVLNDLDAMENGVRKNGVGNLGWFPWSYPWSKK